MLVRLLIPAILAGALVHAGRGAEPAVTVHTTAPAALKEAKTLGVPAFVVLVKPKASAPASADPRVQRVARSFVCAAVPLTAALAKQYELDGDAHLLILGADGEVLETFPGDVSAEKVLFALNKHAAAARAELVKAAARADADAKAKKATLAGLTRIGPFAEDLLPFLTDKDAAVKDTARKTLAAMPPEATAHALLGALNSDDPAVRAAVHPLAVQATGYKAAPLKVFQTGNAEERAAAWDKWNDHAQRQHPPLNRAVLAFCEKNMGAQVNNGECAMLLVEAYKECKAQPMVHSGATYIWGRQLKAGEPVLPGDVVQYEGTKFANGWSYPHHTSVVRKVLAPNRFEVLEQNIGGVKKVQPGKLELDKLKEGSVVIYRPQPK